MTEKGQTGKLIIAGIEVTLVRRPIRHMYLRIYPPEGRVVVTASKRFSLEQVAHFVTERKDYIEMVRSRQALREQTRKRSLSDGGTIYLWGEPYRLSLRSTGLRKAGVEPVSGELRVFLRSLDQRAFAAAPSAAAGERVQAEVEAAAGEAAQAAAGEAAQAAAGETVQTEVEAAAEEAAQAEVKALLTEFYRSEIKQRSLARIAHWEKLTGLQAKVWSFRKMRSRWGSCRPAAASISLNLYLAALPEFCLDYVIVHELAHLRVSAHNRNFYALVDRFYPDRRSAEQVLKGEKYLIL